jgi:hypothetical protein
VADPTLTVAQKLRAYEAKHPLQAIAGGFVPGLGQASSAAALRDPEAPWWEKALNAPGLLPGVGGASKAIVLLASKLRKIDPEAFARAAKFLDPLTGKKMAEIDDSTAVVDHELIDQMTMNDLPMSLEDALYHPGAFKAEPYLSDVGFSVGNVTSPTAAGEYWSKIGNSPGRIATQQADPTRAQSIRNFENTLFHETQHAADDAGGIMTAGGKRGEDYWLDPSEIRARVAAARQKFSPEGRQSYSFDQHMKDEYRRLNMSRARGLPLREADEYDFEYQLGLRNLALEDLTRK